MADTRTLLSITKNVSTVLTAGFGILGLLVEYRNKRTKKTTFWGWVAITGIVASALVSLVSQYEEGVLQSREAADAAKRSDDLLKKIDRLQNPLRDVFITYAVDLPAEAPAIQTFTQQLRAAKSERRKTLLFLPKNHRGPDPITEKPCKLKFRQDNPRATDELRERCPKFVYGIGKILSIRRE